MRLYSYLKTNLGITKSELNKLYSENKITVNDMHVSLSYLINDNDVIKVDNEIITITQYVYYLYYKPKGILSTIRNSDISYINSINVSHKVVPAGRLDKLSEGLMILSNDGKFINHIQVKDNIDKEYEVTLKFPITDDFIEKLKRSYDLNGKITSPFIVHKTSDYKINVILHEGIYHEIRRVCGIAGNKVVDLKRIRIGKYHLNDMKPGDLIEFKLD